MPSQKRRQPLTVILVPHSERAPVSIRVSPWFLPALGVLCLALLAATGILAVRWYSMERQVHVLLQDRQMQLLREREMRSTILAQQEDVSGLSQQVEGFEAELAGVRALSDEIRLLIGMPAPEVIPSVTPAVYASPVVEGAPRAVEMADLDPAGQGGHLGRQLGDHSMTIAVEKSQDVVGMQALVPKTFRDLAYLREQVLERMERIDPAQRTNRVDLEVQLRLLAAAPHLWPANNYGISSKFGYRTLFGKLEFHKGIDIPLWYGSKVRCTGDGVVVSSGWEVGYGYTVEIQHEMGFTTIYGHNSQLLVSVGDEVKAGDVIALSGNSGRSTGPHLHYEIRLNDTSVDPLKYLDADVPYYVQK